MENPISHHIPSTPSQSHTGPAQQGAPLPKIKDICDLRVHYGPGALDLLKAAVEQQLALPPQAPVQFPSPPTPRKLVEFWTYDRFVNYEIPPDFNMVGDFHIQKGAPFVLAGAPGTGKSRAAVALAIAGALGEGTSWFGLPVHTRFRTMILQCENGPVRLRRELEDIALPPEMNTDLWLRISPPPPEGFRFDTPHFLAELSEEIANFKPQLFVLDPWTRLAEDDKAADYRRAFDMLLGALPTGDERPALGIVAHTRKPKSDERNNGRALINIVSGSFVLTAAARSVFVMQHASDDTQEKRVVMTCAKNNDGDLGPRSVWERRNGLFTPVKEFDWEKFDDRAERASGPVTGDHVREALSKGPLSRADTAARLMEIAKVGRSTAYNALKPDSEFSNLFEVRAGLLCYCDPFDDADPEPDSIQRSFAGQAVWDGEGG